MLLDRDGYHEVPNDRLVSVVTYLEMTQAPGAPAPAPLPGVTFRRVHRPDLVWYRQLYGRIGREWLWVSRLAMSDRKLRDEFDDPLFEVWALARDGHDGGLVELDRRRAPDVEIVYFGLVPDMIGQGLGGWLMRSALAEAWRYGTQRVWLHTCTHDHPGALGFYRKLGFKPYKRAVEIALDPRVTGLVPPDAAAHFPLLD